jgi:superfamily II DNA helicase RecQ
MPSWDRTGYSASIGKWWTGARTRSGRCAWNTCPVSLARRLRRSTKKGRIDYREILPSEDFLVFVKLRDLRKQMAQAEAAPVYTIFTNDQLAEMVRRRGLLSYS